MWEHVRGLFDEKLLRFLIVGVFNTIVGTAVMFGFYNILGYSYWISSAANYIIGSILSFFLNKYFTFKSKKSSPEQVIKFVINIAVCYLIAYGIAKPVVHMAFSFMGEKVQDNVAMFIGMCLFTGLNYLGQRFFAFKE